MTAHCGPVFPPGNTGYITGAAFFDQAGNLFLYGNSITNGGANQNILAQVNVSTCAISRVVTGPAVTDSDGASCSTIGH